jgi:diguanylate cyclase (GGDEF)-like protein/putative nucleotidyltransferase with HDIG domain
MDRPQHPQERNYVPWRFLPVFSMLSLLVSVISISRPFPDHCNPLAVLFSGLLCFQGMPALRTYAGSRRRLSPACLGIGMLCLTAGQILQIVPLHSAPAFLPLPLLTHLAYAGMYPFLLCAILLLPAYGLSPLAHLRMLLESLMLMVALSMLCVSVLLAPALFNEHGTLIEKIVGSAYPAADLVLMFCLLLVARRQAEADLRPALFLLEAAILLIFLRHLISVHDVPGTWTHDLAASVLLWLLIPGLLTGAARMISRTVHRDACAPASVQESEQRETKAGKQGRRAFCSPALVLVAGIPLIIFCSGPRLTPFPGQMTMLFIAGFLLLMLLVVRQSLAVYEVAILQDRLQAQNHALHLCTMRLEQQATTGLLTGLPRRRNLVEQLDTTLAMAQATGRSCALLFIEIDHFPMINDRYGQTTGDQVLQRFGRLVQESLPPQACVGRWGEKAFVAILPQSEPSAALRVAECIRSHIYQHRLAGKAETQVTCSLGVASYPQDARARDSLLQSADQARDAAGRLGGNQVRRAHEPLVLLAAGILEAGPEPAVCEEANLLAIVDSLSITLEIRDSETSRHSRRVSALSVKLALMLGLGRAEACVVGLGGLLHDLGKVGVCDDIMLKQGQLTAEERSRMAQHPLTGAQIIAQVPGLQTVAAIVRAHHERLDGSGYPYGLRGQEIPLGARIVSVADAYDALITNRAYRPGCMPDEAVRELLRGAGSQFDPLVVGMLVRLFSATPAPV